MKKFIKIIGIIFSFLLLVIVGALAFLQLSFPRVDPAEDLKIEYSTERVERGRYLAHHVVLCMDCHAERDFSKFAGPPKDGTLGQGGDRFDHQMGFPGVFYAKNITPAGIGDYTDGELYRVITTGVDNEGEPIFPVMPYMYYGKMDPEDIYDVIAYIRSLTPKENEIPESSADFPVSAIIRTVPTNASPTKKPNPQDVLAYGAYMTNASGCIECHTPADPQGMIIQELAFSGGRDFPLPGGAKVTSSNITPHANGIGAWDEDMFVARFKAYAGPDYKHVDVPMGEFNSIMPWTMYAGMKESDLRAIYKYLNQLEPSSNQVVKFTPPSSGD